MSDRPRPATCVEALRRARGHRRRRLGAGEVALRQRRRALPDPAAGGRPAPAHRRDRGHARGRAGDRVRRSPCAAPAPRSPATPIGAGIVIDTSRHLNRVLELEPRGADRTRAAGRRARRAAAAGGPGRAAVRPRPVDPHPLHDRRDDRQQRLRVAGAGLRPHGRQRRGADRAAGRRDGGVGGRDRGGHDARSTPWSTSTSAPSAPSSAASAARSRATPSSTCCRSSGRRFDRFLVGTEGTLGAGARRDRPPGRGRPGPGAGGAGLPDDGRRGGRRTRPARRTHAGRLRGARPAHRRDGRRPPGAARRRRLAVRRGHRRRRGGGRVAGAGGGAPLPACRTGSSPTPSSSSRCGGSARTAPGSRPAR